MAKPKTTPATVVAKARVKPAAVRPKAKPPTAKPATVGSRIEEARLRYGMTQSQLSVMLKVTRAAVSQYEKDQITPRKRVILRLAEVFGAAPEWFEHGHGDQPRPADLPVTVPEIDVGLITPEVMATADLRRLRTGRQFVLPGSMFEEWLRYHHPTDERMTFIDPFVAFAAPNHVAPVREGDRVVVDLRRRTCPASDPGVFLVYVTDERKKHRAQLSHYEGHPIAADILGRVVALLRAL